MKRLLRFGIGGAIGFVVDAGLLMILMHVAGIGPLPARAFAIAAALAATWLFNRTFTFERSGRSLADEGLRYGSVGLTSALLNYGLYTALLLAIPAIQPLAALVLASLSAMAFSFFGYARFVFRRDGP